MPKTFHAVVAWATNVKKNCEMKNTFLKPWSCSSELSNRTEDEVIRGDGGDPEPETQFSLDSLDIIKVAYLVSSDYIVIENGQKSTGQIVHFAFKMFLPDDQAGWYLVKQMFAEK